MKILSVRHLDGPNVFLYRPILMAEIDLESLTERESNEFPEFIHRLLDALPGLREHHCAKGCPGGFVERLFKGTYFGHIIEHVTIELATLCGLDVHYGKTLYHDVPGHYRIVMECKSFTCQSWLLQQALVSVQNLWSENPVDVIAICQQAETIRRRTELGPSTRAIVDACIRRNIPIRRIGDGSLLELGYGKFRKRVAATLTDETSAVAVDIASDKALTKRLLREQGIPVPDGNLATTLAEAKAYLRDDEAKLVVKPLDGSQGRGVSLGVSTNHEMEDAFERACAYSSTVLIEPHLDGVNIRVLVVGNRAVAASLRLAARVVGDGRRTVRELVVAENENPLRGYGHEKPLTRIPLDAPALESLAKQGLGFESTPANGTVVELRDSVNLSTGGEAHDVTLLLHKSYLRLAERCARAIGLNVCGVDMIVEHLNLPATQKNCAVIEVNAAPGIRMHQHPSQGIARDVADAIVHQLFGDGNGRIPIVAITGTNGKTTTTRLIAHGEAKRGKRVGMTTTGGVFIGGECVLSGDTTGPSSARMVLSDASVDVAVLETARGGIVRGGLAYDKADVAILTNITLDHVGQDFIDSVDDLVRVKSLVVECVHPSGAIVLNADDKQLQKLYPRLSNRILLTSVQPNQPLVQKHLQQGGTAYLLLHGFIVEAVGSFLREVIEVADVPITYGGTALFHVENALFATAALRALGQSLKQVAGALTTFLPDANKGRSAIFELPTGGHVILDYAHNPDGFARVMDWLKHLPCKRLIGVVGVPGDRDDVVLQSSACMLSSLFDHYIIKEDVDKRGRAEGEVAQILQQSIAQFAPGKTTQTILSETAAVENALDHLQTGDIVVVFYELFDPLLPILAARGAYQVTSLVRDDVKSVAMQS